MCENCIHCEENKKSTIEYLTEKIKLLEAENTQLKQMVSIAENCVGMLEDELHAN